MFGYVKVWKPELKIREYEEYRGVYCSLCRTLGKEYGQTSRMLLSYDATFYVLLLTMSRGGECPHFEAGRCPFNPTKKCNYQSNNEELYKAAAALTVILSYHKVRDDMQDGGFSKKSAARLIYPLLSGKYKKAAKRYPEFAEIVENTMQKQAQAENENCESVDKAADPSAKSLELLFTLGMEEGTQKTVLGRTAYCIGRFVYLIDAYDDMKSDLKRGSYNPFLLKYQIKSEKELKDPALHEAILQSLHLTANEAALSFNLLDGTVHRSILQNIFYDGLESQMEKVRNAYEEVTKTDV